MDDERILEDEQLQELIDQQGSKILTAEKEERTKLIEGYKILYGLQTERYKVQLDHDEKYKQRLMDHDHWEHEQESKLTQQNIDVDSKNVEFDIKMKQNKMQNIIAICGVATPVLILVVDMVYRTNLLSECLDVEAKGAFTTQVAKNLISMISRGKK